MIHSHAITYEYILNLNHIINRRNLPGVNIRQLIAPLILAGTLSGASAQQASPTQSAARPYSLDITAPVQIAASDAASKIFQTEVLPGMLDLVNKNLGEYRTQSDKELAAISLDPSKLVLNSDATARVYFLGEGAGNRNSLGISTTGGGPLSEDAALIFPDASSPSGYAGSRSLVRSYREPLLAGDFVDLGSFKAGTALDFFLIANGAGGGSEAFSTNLSLNKDGVVHAVSLAPNGSAYLIIGFEDLNGGGDRDYNDLVFAVEIGKNNVSQLAGLGAPEPSLAAGCLLAAAALFGLSRRRHT